jgi:hypothetical protein
MCVALTMKVHHCVHTAGKEATNTRCYVQGVAGQVSSWQLQGSVHPLSMGVVLSTSVSL